MTTPTCPTCPTCNHAAHKPGDCPSDNCGASEMSHTDAIPSDTSRIVMSANYQRGEVTTRAIKHIRPRKTGAR